MPKITIRDVDYTTGGAYLPSSHAVYIPGFSSAESLTGLIGVPTLLTSVNELIAKFGDAPLALGTSDDKSYVMAYELLQLGLPVLYEVPAKTLGGSSAVEIESEMLAALGQTGFWTRLTDRGRYDIRFITAGGYAGGVSAIAKEMTLVASDSGRGDAIALVDHAFNLATRDCIIILYWSWT